MNERANHMINTNGNIRHDKVERLEQALTEAWGDLLTSTVEPDECLYDVDGTRWLSLGGQYGTSPAADAGVVTEQQLSTIRAQCRSLAVGNEFAINGHENRISYIVGAGHSYRAALEPGSSADVALRNQVQSVIDEFIEQNEWHRRQQEIVRRNDRDGETFLRFFADRDGTTRVRFVEPGQIATPAELSGDAAASFGLRTDPDDVETVLGYYIDGVYVDADEIQHRKTNVDNNVKRGLPLFYPVRSNLRRAEKLLRNMAVLSEIQSAIALIRKHRGTSRGAVQQFVSDSADANVTNTTSGKTTHYRRFAPGTILDAPGGLDYEFPAAGIDAASFVAVLQAELRAVASRLVMPEFMLTSDASNSNYASTLVAEGPALKMFARLQAEQILYDRAVMRRVIHVAVSAGRLPREALSEVAVRIAPPSLGIRDQLKDAETYRIELEQGVLSPQTWSQLRGLDYEREQQNIAAHATFNPEP